MTRLYGLIAGMLASAVAVAAFIVIVAAVANG